MTVLKLVEVCKQSAGLEALRGVSLTVHEGRGGGRPRLSGSGKSTLLTGHGHAGNHCRFGPRCTWWARTPALGERALASLRARSIGFVFQQFFLLDGMTANSTTWLTGLLYADVAPGERRVRAREALAAVGLDHRSSHSAGEALGR